MSIILEYAKFKKLHMLSGIALIVDKKICLVLARKHKDKKKYSIPKGHLEIPNPYQNAYLELLEETGIDIGLTQYEERFKYTYIKNGAKKTLITYLIRMNKEDYDQLDKRKWNTNEIIDMNFFSKKEALKITDPKMKKLIRYIFKKID
jgi:8-oxo-dGTP pyrophosphatase MutT (NUDIX family)